MPHTFAKIRSRLKICPGLRKKSSSIEISFAVSSIGCSARYTRIVDRQSSKSAKRSLLLVWV
ncbi:Uncharacterised protein [Vibrio cholerae]|nr:Uncharacterised protein [Vibrio cholerae]